MHIFVSPRLVINVKAGDFIIAVDNVSLEGKSLDESQDLLRGIVNKPIEIKYQNEDGVNTTVLRRIQMFLVENEDEKVAMNGKELVAVLNEGKTGVYLEKAEHKSVDFNIQKVSSNGIVLNEVSRNEIYFTSDGNSPATIEISNVDGSQVALLKVNAAGVGSNVVHWNGNKIPNGQYIVSITQSNKNSSKIITFR